jgi:DNA-binding GntR family transcriptional regulator
MSVSDEISNFTKDLKLGSVILSVQTRDKIARARTKMTPIDRETFQEQSYRKLREALMSGRFLPNDTVSLRTLALELGTSPMPIREAVHRLIAEGALELRPNRTFAVPIVTREKLRDLRHLRILIEGGIAEEASRHISPDDVAEMNGLNDEMISALSRNDSKRYLAKNRDFHFTLYRSAGIHFAIEIIEMLWLQIGPSTNHLLRQGPTDQLPFLTRHHQDLMKAISSGDVKGARSAIEGDIDDGMTFLYEACPS